MGSSSSSGTYTVDSGRGVVVIPGIGEVPIYEPPRSGGIGSRSEWIDAVTIYLIDAYISGAQMPGPADFWADTNFLALFGQLPDKRLRGAGEAQITAGDYEIFRKVAEYLWNQGVSGGVDFGVWRGIPRPDPSLPNEPPRQLTDAGARIIAEIINGENAARVAAINAQAQVDAAKIYAGAQVESARIGAEAQVRAAEIHAAATVRAAEIQAEAERYRTEMEWAARVMEEDGRNRRFNLELAENRRQFNLALLKDYYMAGVELAKKPVDWIGYQYYLQNMGLPITLGNMVAAAYMFGAIPPSGPSVWGPVVGGPAIYDGYGDIAVHVAGASGPDDPALFPDIATATALHSGIAQANGGYGGFQTLAALHAAATAQGQTLADVQGQISQNLVSGAGVPEDVAQVQQATIQMLVSSFGADTGAMINALNEIKLGAEQAGVSGAQAVNAVRDSLQQQAQPVLSQNVRPLAAAVQPQVATAALQAGTAQQAGGTAQGLGSTTFVDYGPPSAQQPPRVPTTSGTAPWAQWMSGRVTQPGEGVGNAQIPVPPPGTNPFYTFLQYTAQQLGIPFEQMAQIAGLPYLTPYYGDLSQVIPQTPIYQAVAYGTPLNRYRIASPEGEKFGGVQAAGGVPLGIRSGQDINLGEYLRALPSQQEMIQGLIESSGQYFPDTLAQMMRASPMNPDVMPGIPGVRRR